MKFSKWYFTELEVMVTGDYQPGRPAPYCNDHDSPTFSDPGDPEEMNDVAVYLKNGIKQIEITKYLLPDVYKEICDDMLIAMEEDFNE